MSAPGDHARARLVVLHTSDARGVVGIATRERIVAERLESHGQHARSLLGTLERIVQRAKVRLADVEGIATTVGPGSFTGIRIGLATAQGLAAARDWPVWTCDSLRAEAAAVLHEVAAADVSAPSDVLADDPGALAIVQDARRGEVYAALYDEGTTNTGTHHASHADATGAPLPRVRLEPFCADPAVASARIRAASSSGAVVAVGSGAASLVAAAREQHGDVAVWRERQRPDATAIVAALAAMARAGACTRLDAQQLEPMYLRKSDAEIKRELEER